MAAAPAVATSWNGAARLHGVDLARGLAVLGMLAAHLVAIPEFDGGEFDWAQPDTWTDVANGRSSILFAVLAGVSIALVSGGTRPRRGAALGVVRGRLAVRAVLVWSLGIGLIVTTVPVLVILPAYGILFLLALPLLGLSSRTLWLLAGALALVMPWVQPGLDDLPVWESFTGGVVALALGWAYPFPLWLAFIVTGLAIGRLDLRAARTQLALLAGGAFAAGAGYGLDAVIGARGDDEVWTAEAHSGGVLEVIGSGGFAVAVLGLCLLVCRTPLTWVVVPLRAVGSMPLSAYTAQLLVWVVVAAVAVGDVADGDAFRALQPFWPMTLGIVVACTLWALLLGRGPLERLFAWIARLVVPGGPRGVRLADGGARARGW